MKGRVVQFNIPFFFSRRDQISDFNRYMNGFSPLAFGIIRTPPGRHIYHMDTPLAKLMHPKFRKK